MLRNYYFCFVFAYNIKSSNFFNQISHQIEYLHTDISVAIIETLSLGIVPFKRKKSANLRNYVQWICT